MSVSGMMIGGPILDELGLEKEILDRIRAFTDFDRNCVEAEQVLELIEKNEKNKLERLFSGCLDFGTSGIRATIGAGLKQINSYTVVQISLAFYQYLDEKCRDALNSTGVAISYDGRTNSQHYAQLTAAIFMSKGVAAYIYPLCPTPLLAFIVKNYRYCAGVMITASHNPKEYNGYKVYIEGGCQIASPDDRLMTKKIVENRFLDFKTIKQFEIAKYVSRLYACDVGPVMTDYCLKLKQIYHFCPKVIEEMKKTGSLLKITFSALHGVSSGLMRRAVNIFGLDELIEVVEQAEPDPEFPTVKFPNPEEYSALQLAVKTAEENDSELVIATDPDGDRLAIIEKKDGKWKIFNGNEIATILGHLAFRLYKENVSHQNRPMDKAFMLYTTVSSKILKTIALQEGFNCIETPPGFKFIGNKIKEINEEIGGNLIFGFEESLGYMMGDEISREKDGISTGILICLLANQLFFQNSGHWSRADPFISTVDTDESQLVKLCVNSKNVSRERLNKDANDNNEPLNNDQKHKNENNSFVDKLNTNLNNQAKNDNSHIDKINTNLNNKTEKNSHIDKLSVESNLKTVCGKDTVKSTHYPLGNFKLQDHLNDIFETYGYHQCITSYFSFQDDDSIVKRVFEHVINSGKYYDSFDSHKVTHVRDVTGLVHNTPYDTSQKCDMPLSRGSPMVTYGLDDNATLTVRKSGTEKKIKYYIEVVGKTAVPNDLLNNAKQIEKKVVFDVLFSPFLSELHWKGNDSF